MRFRTILVILITCAAVSCHNSKSIPISFYYWKTTFELTEFERETLELNHVTKLYVRYFDIALVDKQPVPVSPINFVTAPRGFTIVPVIYIRNEVVQDPKLQVNDLASKIVAYIQQINKRFDVLNSDLQLDCDWSLTSKESYFDLIEAIKQQTLLAVTTTIRLHQVKYFERTGVPPVNSGTLMYYNMNRVADDSINSIYDQETANRYTERLKAYPLPLSVALPIFSWGIHIRNNHIMGLISKVDLHSFQDSEGFRKDESVNFYEADRDVLKAGRYFKKGDRVKIESVRPQDVAEMIDDLSEKMNPPSEIIFYDLDSVNLIPFSYEPDFFQKVSRNF